MLARLPLGYLLLMAACATLLLHLAVQVGMSPPRKAHLILAAVSVGVCLAMIGVGAAQPQQWNARQMLVLFVFVWGGLAVGLLLSSGGLRRFGVEARKPGPPPPFPAHYVFIVCTSTVVMSGVGYFLAN